ncbi:MAG TPA: hypothetical protein VEF04_01200, partial [Blastocatellia bacterium]|nr:hypothetical protein [Blastocatellia bacterium]
MNLNCQLSISYKRKLIIFALLTIYLLSLSSVTILAQTKNDPNKKEWIQLFNGKDLKDWTVKIAGHEVGDNFGNTFRVKDGKMTVGYEKYDEFAKQYGHI